MVPLIFAVLLGSGMHKLALVNNFTQSWTLLSLLDFEVLTEELCIVPSLHSQASTVEEYYSVIGFAGITAGFRGIAYKSSQNMSSSSETN